MKARAPGPISSRGPVDSVFYMKLFENSSENVNCITQIWENNYFLNDSINVNIVITYFDHKCIDWNTYNNTITKRSEIHQ